MRRFAVAMSAVQRRLLPVPPWVIVYVGVNLALIIHHTFLVEYRTGIDWELWRSLAGAIADGRLYNIEGITLWYAWSPVFAPVMALVGQTGMWPWVAAHFLVLPLLRSWPLIALMVVSWGFWVDVAAGNTFTFVVVAGALAFRGSRAAAIVYLGLCLLMPRPVQLPLAIWLLWHMRDVRLPALGMFIGHSLAVLATGYALDWMSVIDKTLLPAWNKHPFEVLGLWWLVIGIPLGGWLLWRGRPGLAGLAISTYLLGTYLLMPLVEVRAWKTSRSMADDQTGTKESKRDEVMTAAEV